MLKRKLYTISAIEVEENSPWDQHDIGLGMIVRASSEKEARDIASQNCGDEGPDAWVSEKYSTCEELLAAGEPGLIVQSYQPVVD